LRHEIIAGGRAGPPRFEPLPKPDKMTNGSADSYEADSFVPSLQPLSNELASIMTIIGEHGPRGYAPISWDHAEQRLSVRLPIDYKQCIDTLGAGSFRDLHVVAPDCPVPDFDLFALIDRISEGGGAISYEPADRPENPEFAIQGLIPWGWTDDGLTFFWKAEEKPADEWLIFLSQPDFISFRLMAVGQKKLSTTGVIARYLLDPLSIVERLIDSRTRTVVDPRVPPELPLFSPAL
jgi:hypothetical protein